MKIWNITPDRPLSEASSLLLDVVRFSVAIAVVIGHVTHPEFHTSVNNLQYLGDYAVPVFFVLSGFVIRFVTRTRESNATEYFISRISRMYSVAIPAMLITVLITAFGFLYYRSQLVAGWGDTYDHSLVRLSFNLLFVSQAWGHNTIPFLDSPFWSLGYECPYYVFYGFVFFLRGWKRILCCLLLATVLGPQVLFLLPVWWLGCWLYDIFQWARSTQLRTIVPSIAAIWLTLSVVLALFGRPALLRLPLALVDWIAAIPHPFHWFGIPEMRATMLAVGVGVCSAILLFALLLTMEHISLSRSAPWARRVRRIADGTFTIYLMHYPLLVLASFLGLLRFQKPILNTMTATAIVLLLIAAAIPTDYLKRVMRSALHRRLVVRQLGSV